MLPGSSLLARLAGRQRPLWRRLVVKYTTTAPLHEERSESRLATVLPQSGDYRGQRFMPLLGVGGLIGAAVTEAVTAVLGARLGEAGAGLCQENGD